VTYFFIFIYANCSGRHDVGQGNVNILQHLYVQSDRPSGARASTKFFLNYQFNFIEITWQIFTS